MFRQVRPPRQPVESFPVPVVPVTMQMRALLRLRTALPSASNTGQCSPGPFNDCRRHNRPPSSSGTATGQGGWRPGCDDRNQRRSVLTRAVGCRREPCRAPCHRRKGRRRLCPGDTPEPHPPSCRDGDRLRRSRFRVLTDRHRGGHGGEVGQARIRDRGRLPRHRGTARSPTSRGHRRRASPPQKRRR